MNTPATSNIRGQCLTESNNITNATFWNAPKSTHTKLHTFQKQIFAMLKKIKAILLFLMYGSATMGATIHLHYCINQMVGWSLWHSKKEECGRCDMKKNKTDYFKNKHKHFKLKADQHNAATAVPIAFKPAPAIVNPIPDLNFQAFKKVTESFSIYHAPPDIGNTRLHIFLCVYLI